MPTTTYRIQEHYKLIYPEGMTKLRARMHGKCTRIPTGKYYVSCCDGRNIWDSDIFDNEQDAEKWIAYRNNS